MTKPYQHILLEKTAGVAKLTLARPEKLNAMAEEGLDEIIGVLDGIAGEDDTRALLITGQGRAFCSGADMSATGGNPATAQDKGAGLESHYNPIMERLRALPVPIVAAVNGVAAGGGCGLALGADIVIAARSAYFLQPFANIGLVPDAGATWLLPRLVGKARATAMMMLGERVSAEQAVEWGLIYGMVENDELMAKAHGIAARLAKGPTRSYALMRQAIARALETGLTDALTDERHNQRTAGLTTDHCEGVAAFLQKRTPVFEGR